MPTLSQVLCRALVAGLVARAAVAAPPQTHDPELIVIEPVGGAALSESRLLDVSDVGLVVGRNSINDVLVPLEWTAGSGFRTPTHLPPPLASPSSALLPRLHVNNHGDSIASGFPFLIRADGALVPIPDPLGGVSFGGEDVDDSLRVIGQGVPTGTSSGIFTWSPQSGSVTLQIPSGSAVRRISA